ncbi:MAG TPA: hypothetical protein PLF62_10940, partial [Clostridia bacterium]|nr:hypothetical protein [Clostridia bacterium]
MKKPWRITVLILALLLAASPAMAACVHNWVNTSIREDPTCTKDGWVLVMCTLCGDNYKDPIPSPGHDPGPWKVKTPATCIDDGVEHQTCNRCGVELATWPILALGHDPGAWKVKTPPTCINDGVEHILCNRCGAELATAPLAALTHLPGPWKVKIPPTCT